MALTAADVAEIMRLVEDSAFDELTLELDGMKLHFRRGAESVGATDVSAVPPPAPQPAALNSPMSPSVEAAPDPSMHDVAAPLLGTFYRAPKPGAPPFVEVGSSVDDDTIVGIIEVMKLMNPVRAGAHGRVTEILCQDGVLVEYGQVLMRIGKDR
jgi:acetyl-CoA carboxylase biotin carboxyl carrier protein